MEAATCTVLQTARCTVQLRAWHADRWLQRPRPPTDRSTTETSHAAWQEFNTQCVDEAGVASGPGSGHSPANRGTRTMEQLTYEVLLSVNQAGTAGPASEMQKCRLQWSALGSAVIAACWAPRARGRPAVVAPPGAATSVAQRELTRRESANGGLGTVQPAHRCLGFDRVSAVCCVAFCLYMRVVWFAAEARDQSNADRPQNTVTLHRHRRQPHDAVGLVRLELQTRDACINQRGAPAAARQGARGARPVTIARRPRSRPRRVVHDTHVRLVKAVAELRVCGRPRAERQRGCQKPTARPCIHRELEDPARR